MSKDFDQTLNNLLGKGDLDKASEIIEDHKDKLAPEEHLFLKATIIYRQGDIQTACKLLLKNIEEYPGHAKSLLNYSVILWKQDQLKEAIAYARKARDADEEDLEVHQNLIDMLMESGNKKGALKAILRVLEQFEGFIPALKLAATIYIERQEWVKARYYIDLMESYEAETTRDVQTLRSLLPNT